MYLIWISFITSSFISFNMNVIEKSIMFYYSVGTLYKSDNYTQSLKMSKSSLTGLRSVVFWQKW